MEEKSKRRAARFIATLLVACLLFVPAFQHPALAWIIGEDPLSEHIISILPTHQIRIIPTGVKWGGGGIVTSEVVIDLEYPALEVQNIGTAPCDVFIKTNASGLNHLGNWIMIRDATGVWYYITLNITTTAIEPVTYEINWTGHDLLDPLYYGFFFISDANPDTERFVRFWFIHNTTHVKIDLDRDGLVRDETPLGVGASFNLTLPAEFVGVGTEYWVKQLHREFARFGRFKDGPADPYGVDFISDLGLLGIERRDWICAVPFGMPAGDYRVLITLTAAEVA